MQPEPRSTSRLAERLRAETRDLHTAAERSPFMAVLLRSRMERPAYAALLRNLLALYAALEPALARHAEHKALAPLDAGRLARLPALRQDLAVIGDSGDDLPVQPATARYVERLRELDASGSEKLLAHAYVRYLGDLSGGQMLRGIVARSLGLGSDAGVAFYDFGDAAAVSALARRFREGLDAAVIDDEDAVVEEAKLAFEWHRQLFVELASAHGLPAEIV
jgi:heme oxygenase (biliverdin-producing, ferredoxin)